MPDEASYRAPLLDIASLTVSYGGAPVLDAVDLRVDPGEIVTVIGPNGAGKTTLLRAALGLTVPDSGAVQRAADLVIGYMPQRVSIDQTLPLTVRRFLSLGARVPRGRRREILDEVGVRHLLDRPVQAVSGGEMQRVLLGRALLRDPQLLVLDEPAQGLDVAGQGHFYELIGQLRDRRGCGVLMVSHDLYLVMAATDRVVCLNHHICCTGAPQDVRENPEYLALFPDHHHPSALGVYTHQHDHEHTLAGDVAAGHSHGHSHHG